LLPGVWSDVKDALNERDGVITKALNKRYIWVFGHAALYQRFNLAPRVSCQTGCL